MVREKATPKSRATIVNEKSNQEANKNINKKQYATNFLELIPKLHERNLKIKKEREQKIATDNCIKCPNFIEEAALKDQRIIDLIKENEKLQTMNKNLNSRLKKFIKNSKTVGTQTKSRKSFEFGTQTLNRSTNDFGCQGTGVMSVANITTKINLSQRSISDQKPTKKFKFDKMPTVYNEIINDDEKEPINEYLTEDDNECDVVQCDDSNKKSEDYEILKSNVHGSIIWFNFKKCFGFIQRHDKDEQIYVHGSSFSIPNHKMRIFLKPNKKLIFDVAKYHNKKLLDAVNVKVISYLKKHPVGRTKKGQYLSGITREVRASEVRASEEDNKENNKISPKPADYRKRKKRNSGILINNQHLARKKRRLGRLEHNNPLKIRDRAKSGDPNYRKEASNMMYQMLSVAGFTPSYSSNEWS